MSNIAPVLSRPLNLSYQICLDESSAHEITMAVTDGTMLLELKTFHHTLLGDEITYFTKQYPNLVVPIDFRDQVTKEFTAILMKEREKDFEIINARIEELASVFRTKEFDEWYNSKGKDLLAKDDSDSKEEIINDIGNMFGMW